MHAPRVMYIYCLADVAPGGSGKLLQEAFYKPVRRLGLSRVVAMLCCFTGSAVLHAFPQYISTYRFDIRSRICSPCLANNPLIGTQSD